MKKYINTSKFKRMITVLIISSIGVLIFTVFTIKTEYDHSFARVEAKDPNFSAYLKYSDVNNVKRTDIQFESGVNTLKGYIYGEENDKGLIVIAHGLGYGSENYLAETIYFVEKGWRVLAFDNTGTHASEGDNTVGPSQSRLDLKTALSYIEHDEALNSLPLMLYGHSWGAYAVTAILNEATDVQAVVSISGFNSPMGLLSEQIDSQLGWRSQFVIPFMELYQKALFGKNANHTAVDGINHSSSAVLIIHGNEDESIAYDGASIIAHKADIVNPNVIYHTASNDPQNGHNSLTKSLRNIAYVQLKNLEYEALYKEHEGEIPDDIKRAYYADVDRWLTSELDEGIMRIINDFYNVHLINQ